MKYTPELKEFLNQLITSKGYNLDDVSVSKENNETFLNVTVSWSKPLDVNILSELSTFLSDELDKFVKDDDPYILNVQSNLYVDLINFEDLKNHIEEKLIIEFKNEFNGINETKCIIHEIKDDKVYLQYFLKGAKRKLELNVDDIKKGDIKFKTI